MNERFNETFPNDFFFSMAIGGTVYHVRITQSLTKIEVVLVVEKPKKKVTRLYLLLKFLSFLMDLHIQNVKEEFK